MTKPNSINALVKRVVNETRDIKSFVLARENGEALPNFEPGSHIDVEPVGGVTRQYSILSESSQHDHYVIGVKREANGRGGSNAMHDLVKEGSVLPISPPRNQFELADNNGRSLLLGGGIGITPLLCMAQALFAKNKSFELHYFVRTNEDLAFSEFLANCKWRNVVHFHFGLIPPALNDALGEILATPNDDDFIYLCGPTPFMEVVREEALSAGWAPDVLRTEYFTQTLPELSADSSSFVVRLAESGVDVVVPKDQTIVEALRSCGIEIETSCEQGVCGTCVTTVIEGEVEHQDLYLTDEERERQKLFTPCCSRASSKVLVIKL